mmetsp:Transcript_953/g.1190  ORF Transcript_953/g.1190 Transcript_953/m.1190 type:complete len:95 (+) Transcript_953:51-335(+)
MSKFCTIVNKSASTITKAEQKHIQHRNLALISCLLQCFDPLKIKLLSFALASNVLPLQVNQHDLMLVDLEALSRRICRNQDIGLRILDCDQVTE